MRFEEDKHNFTFHFDSSDGEKSLDMNCNELYLDDILYRFKEFLQGCGYQVDGNIEIAPWDLSGESFQGKDKFDFSNLPNNSWPFGDSNPSTQASEK